MTIELYTLYISRGYANNKSKKKNYLYYFTHSDSVNISMI